MHNDSMINYYIVMIFCLFQCSARHLRWGNSASYAVDRFICDRQLINVQTDLLKSQGKWLNFYHSLFQSPSSLTNYSAFVSSVSTSPWACDIVSNFYFLILSVQNSLIITQCQKFVRSQLLYPNHFVCPLLVRIFFCCCCSAGTVD